MLQARYIVEVNQTQALKLSAEHIELATQLDNGATKLLIYRDRFFACKVATRSGGTFHLGQVSDGEAPQGGLSLEGRTLKLVPGATKA